ncbi:energy-coupling factor ABC transporter ATP-binding protein [Halosegnis marinus]|uniref:Energy-coupling factor ABC transporter ATP-binding protein n=1 Tax=Halosegnis marinus TaxID=3034023 RepID=A0ABD5ZPK5_9EURY|nr:ABC transporter ATP-binding protein [Halosegnis sp. DT85]
MIEIEGLVHRYGDTAAVDGVTLSLADGEYVVLAGPNGSGKSTLVRHLNALLEPDEGEVRVDGVPAHEDPVAARTAVGMTFQDPRDGFVAATVRADVTFGPENLGLPRDEIERRADAALAAVNLDGRGDERIDALSGGERTRVAVAGALAMEPDHLVLDEPFAGLDWPARRELLARLDDLVAGGTGVLVVTHDLRDHLERADRVVVLRDGRVALDAPPERARDRLAEFDVRPP